jgi:hypothetical protein
MQCYSGSQQDPARETQSPAKAQTIQALQDELSRLDARLHVASSQKKKSEQATRSPTRSPVDAALSADAAKVQKEIEDLRVCVDVDVKLLTSTHCTRAQTKCQLLCKKSAETITTTTTTNTHANTQCMHR